ncbi:MAG: ABC transporter permease [Mycoplasmatales bacterium]|nr:ABC transporter permease [Mycoplasmatales bacterium]
MTNIKATSKLIFKTLYAQPLGIIITFIAPSLLTILLPFLFEPIMNTGMGKTLEMLIPGLLLIPSFILGFLGIPMTYGTLKETGTLKKLNVAGIQPREYIFSMIIIFASLISMSSLWQYILTLAIWQSDVPMPQNGLFIIPFILLMVVSISVGILISNIASSQATAFAMGIAMFLPTLFLSGIMFAKLEGWPKYVSWFIPHTGFINLFKISFVDGTLNFENANTFDLTWFDEMSSTIYAFIYPTLISSLLTFITIKKFNFQ